LNEDLAAIVSLLTQSPSHQRWPVAIETWFSGCDQQELNDLVELLLQQDPPLPTDDEEANWGRLFEHMLQRLRSDFSKGIDIVDPSVDKLCEVYEFLGPASQVRHLLLAVLAQRSDSESIEKLVSLLIESPPIEVSGFAIALSPFLKRDTDWELLFPRLFQALSHPVAASAILDLSNYITRQGKVDRHPAIDLVDQLEQLLNGVVNQLASIEDGSIMKTAINLTPEDIASQVNEGIALTAALCDSIALIGNEDKTSALFQAMDLAHRRIQAEAAAALVRLNCEAGSQRLGGLAEEPSVRLRVLAYAEELGVISEIDAAHQSPQARAEGALALHLSEPHIMGLPPTSLKLHDHSQLFWPGFDSKQDCFLFEYEYSLGGEQLSNIGIGAPEVLSSGSDLLHLSTDDLYAYFAGLVVAHTDIFEMPADDLDSQAQIQAGRYQQRLEEAGYEDVKPVTFGFFFEHQALAATACKDDRHGVVVVDKVGILWFPQTSLSRTLTADDAYHIYKGRKLFESFEVRAD